jgi:hypothetical protein
MSDAGPGPIRRPHHWPRPHRIQFRTRVNHPLGVIAEDEPISPLRHMARNIHNDHPR